MDIKGNSVLLWSVIKRTIALATSTPTISLTSVQIIRKEPHLDLMLVYLLTENCPKLHHSGVSSNRKEGSSVEYLHRRF